MIGQGGFDGDIPPGARDSEPDLGSVSNGRPEARVNDPV